jgi:Zn-dependent protease with chaperone function
MKPIIDIRQARAKLRVLRWAAWIIFLGEIVSVSGCAFFLFHHGEHLPAFFKTFVPVFLFWQILPLLAFRFAVHKKCQVRPTGNSWQIGKYSEEEVRSLAHAATKDLPSKLRNPRIFIADHKGTGAWTWLSLLWPGWERRKTIWITEGSLHYLEPDEIKALVVHEIAHHDPVNRYDIPGGWLFGDVALFALLTWVGAQFYLAADGVFVAFFIVRPIVLAIRARIVSNASRITEHLCDVYAAEKAGMKAMINVLLKTGEEEELTGVVLARAAKKLLYLPDIETEDLLFAFEKVRPHGRIFHDNLFRHAGALVRSVVDELKLDPATLERRNRANKELSAYLKERTGRRYKRIRWRELDADGNSQLSQAEIARLCDRLRGNPDAILFLSESEKNPTTHPACRSRILTLSTIES